MELEEVDKDISALYSEEIINKLKTTAARDVTKYKHCSLTIL